MHASVFWSLFEFGDNKIVERFLATQSSECSRCPCFNANFLHAFWICPAIYDYWAQVLQPVHAIMAFWVSQDIYPCLLSLLNSWAVGKATKTLFSIMLYYARKAIVLH